MRCAREKSDASSGGSLLLDVFNETRCNDRTNDDDDDDDDDDDSVSYVQ
jgi:hypothetical protein